jgi:hypothetical protein
MKRIVAVGLASDPGPGVRVDLLLFPDETAPEPRQGLTVYAPASLEAALHILRHVFADHSEILTLAQTDVVGPLEHPWTDAIESRLAQFIEDLGNSVFDCWEGARNVIWNGPRFEGSPTSDQLRDSLKGKPAICLAAGPSATPEMLGRIRELRNSHVIFSAEVMLGACRKAGFAPDFVSIIERPPGTRQFVKGLGEESTLIATAVVDPETVAAFPRVVWWRAGDRIYDWLFPEGATPVMAGRSTGVLSVAAAILAGCNPIYLVGHDLAYGPNHATHCASVHAEAPEMLKVAEQAIPDCYGREQLTTTNWKGEPVATNGFWNLFRLDIETIVADSPGTKVIVASGQDGAAIRGVEIGELPAARYHTPMLVRPRIPGSTLANPAERRESLLHDVERLWHVALFAQVDLWATDLELDKIAERLAISKIVSPENVPFFQYVFQTLNHSLALRLALRPDQQAECLRLLAKTMMHMCQPMMDSDLRKACP